MEQKLKQQRNKLFLRIILILFAVWLTVSLVYCAIIIYSEKNNVQKRELLNLSNITQDMINVTNDYELYDYFFRDSTELLYINNGTQRNWNSQMIMSDHQSGETIIDTKGKELFKFGFKVNPDHPSYEYGFIDYKDLRRRIPDNSYKKIEKWLNTKSDDGQTYELVCTKFAIVYFDFIPTELQIVLVQDKNTWFVYDTVIETFPLDASDITDAEIYDCNEMRRNIIPIEFLNYNLHNDDIIMSLTQEQRESNVDMISSGGFEYIFYAIDNLHIGYPGTDNEFFTVQYAKRINLIEICKKNLIIGVLLIFVFFFVISIILCLSIWKIIETQAMEEKNRDNLTNALAHDIKTPLFVISGYAYSLKENIDETERDTYLDKIIEQTDKINTLVHNMLNLSKLNSYGIVLNLSEFDLVELTKCILKDYKYLPDSKTLTFDYCGDNTVKADRSLITTALNNLIDNAILYSIPGTEIEINISDKIIQIKNKCEPLSKSELKQIWQPYVRKDKSRHQKGNGLGLSIVKSIFDLHKLKYNMQMEDNTLICTVDF